MKIQRTIPPAAAPVTFAELLWGAAGLFDPGGVERFEGELKDYFSVKYVFLLNSGKSGLSLILSSLKAITGRRKVIIPSYTCFSVPSAVIKSGLKIEICDIDRDTLDYDYSLLKDKLDGDTLCVIQNHLFAIPSNVERLKEACRERDIFVVEDAAQAMGVRKEERLLGTMGDVGFYSLGRGKNITSGSGGIVITDSDLIGKGIERFYRSVEKEPFLDKYLNFISVKMIYFFMRPYLYWFPSGLPFLGLGETVFFEDFPIYRFEGTRAGFLKGWMEKLESQNRERVIKGRYLQNRLGLLKNVATFAREGTSEIPYLRFPLLVENREVKETLCARGMEMGLGISPMYPESINRLKELQKVVEKSVCPGGEDVVERLVTIPTHSLLGKEDLDDHCTLVESLCGKAGRG